MLIGSLFLLLLSNSLTARRDMTIYYSRIGMAILLSCLYLSYNKFFLNYLDVGVGLYGGLIAISPITIIFHNLIYLLSSIILCITGFYPRKYISNNSQIISNLKNKIRRYGSNNNKMLLNSSDLVQQVFFIIMVLLITGEP